MANKISVEGVIVNETAVSAAQQVKHAKSEKKIRDEWVNDMLVWSADGMSLPSIAKKIASLYKVSVTPKAISNRINKTKRSRASESRKIVQENIGDYILGDLEVLKVKKAELNLLCDQFRDDKAWPNYWKAIAALQEYSKMIFDLSGVHEGKDNSEAENAKQDLLDMFSTYEFKSAKELNDGK